MHIVQDYNSVLILNTTLLTQLYNMRLVTCEKHLHHFTKKRGLDP